jgi:steroid delta-isomerase-like uncharacterized protein
MSAEKNKNIAREYIEQVWNGRRPDLIEQYMAENVVHHDATGVTDRATIQKVIVSTLEAIPDFKVGIEAAIAEGDLVVLRQTLSGTQQGEFMGLPASGKQFSAKAVYILRIAGGKITDLWGLNDTLGIMQQLGAIPAPQSS